VSSPLYAEIVEKGLPDSVFLTRKPTEREVVGFEPARERAAATAARHRRPRPTAARARGAARPLPRRVTLMVLSLVLGTAASLAPAPLAAQAIDHGILPRDYGRLVLIVVAFVVAALLVWGDDRGSDLPRRVGRQRALADPAHGDLHPPPAVAGQLLRAAPGGAC